MAIEQRLTETDEEYEARKKRIAAQRRGGNDLANTLKHGGGGMPPIATLFAAQTASTTTIELIFNNPEPLAAVAAEYSVHIDAGSETPTNATQIKNVITLTVTSTMSSLSVISVSHVKGSGIAAFFEKSVKNIIT